MEGGGEAGTFGTINGHGCRAGRQPSELGYSADASRFPTDGIYRFNSDYGNTALSASLRALPTPRTDATVSARFNDSRYHFPTDFAGILSDSNQASAEEMLSLAADVGRRFSDRVDVRLTAGGNRTDGTFDDLPDSPSDTLGFGFASHRDSRARTRQPGCSGERDVGDVVTITAGAQVERESERQSGETTSNFGGIATTPDTPFDRHRTTFGYYAQGLLDLPGGLAVNLNARLDDNSAFRHLLHLSGGSSVSPAERDQDSGICRPIVQGADLLRAVLRCSVRRW